MIIARFVFNFNLDGYNGAKRFEQIHQLLLSCVCGHKLDKQIRRKILVDVLVDKSLCFIRCQIVLTLGHMMTYKQIKPITGFLLVQLFDSRNSRLRVFETHEATVGQRVVAIIFLDHHIRNFTEWFEDCCKLCLRSALREPLYENVIASISLRFLGGITTFDVCEHLQFLAMELYAVGFINSIDGVALVCELNVCVATGETIGIALQFALLNFSKFLIKIENVLLRDSDGQVPDKYISLRIWLVINLLEADSNDFFLNNLVVKFLLCCLGCLFGVELSVAIVKGFVGSFVNYNKCFSYFEPMRLNKLEKVKVVEFWW